MNNSLGFFLPASLTISLSKAKTPFVAKSPGLLSPPPAAINFRIDGILPFGSDTTARQRWLQQWAKEDRARVDGRLRPIDPLDALRLSRAKTRQPHSALSDRR